MTATLTADAGYEMAGFEAAFAADSFSPTFLDSDPCDMVEADWAIAGAVAAILGLSLAVVIYICSVCQARSFTSCYWAVINYWGWGC